MNPYKYEIVYDGFNEEYLIVYSEGYVFNDEVLNRCVLCKFKSGTEAEKFVLEHNKEVVNET